jgi:protein-disulfide isomerase
MASRKEQKEAARRRRLAEEQAARQKAQRARRLQMLGGVVVAAIIVVVVLVVVSSGGGSKSVIKPNSAKAKTVAASVNHLLKGIPQSGTTIGNPKAKVTVTEYGDLECPACQAFALEAEPELIKNQIRAGQVKLVYKSFPTATGGLKDGSTLFPVQQSAAYAAGAQGKAWNYILIFYHEQQQEDTPYVNTAFLTDIAKQVPGLKLKTWASERFNPRYSGLVLNEEKQAKAMGIQATPGIVVSGPTKRTPLYSGALSYPDLQTLIKKVS